MPPQHVLRGLLCLLPVQFFAVYSANSGRVPCMNMQCPVSGYVTHCADSCKGHCFYLQRTVLEFAAGQVQDYAVGSGGGVQ